MVQMYPQSLTERGKRQSSVLPQQDRKAAMTTRLSGNRKKTTKTATVVATTSTNKRSWNVAWDQLENENGSSEGYDASDVDELYESKGDEDDEEIDSDAALGESDEERFSEYVFRGSKSNMTSSKTQHRFQSQISTDQEEAAEENEEDLEGAIDLSDMLDAQTEPRIPKSYGTDHDLDASDIGSQANMTDVVTASDELDCAQKEEKEEAADEFLNGETDSENCNTVEEADAAIKLISGVSSILQVSLQPPLKRFRLENSRPAEESITRRVKLSIADVLPTLQDIAIKRSVGRIQNTPPGKITSGVPGKLFAPLPKLHRDRLDREEAFEKSKTTLSRWVDTVKHIREAEHVSFPLTDPSTPQNGSVLSSNKISRVKAAHTTNELETKISDILGISKVDDNKIINDFEDVATKKLSLKDVQARNAQLRLTRETLFREEMRLKRLKKIKSKAYRRALKRDRLKSEKAILIETEENDSLSRDVDGHERERLRAQERMDLRHKQSRWAKDVRRHGELVWNEEARNEISEMAHRTGALRGRIEDEHLDDQENDDDDLSDDTAQDHSRHLSSAIRVTKGSDQSQRLMNLKFMKFAEGLDRLENNKLENEIWQSVRSDADDDNLEAKDRDSKVGKRVFRDSLASTYDMNQEKQYSQQGERFDLDIISSSRVDSTKSLSRSKPSEHETQSLSADALVTVNPWLSYDRESNPANCIQIDVPGNQYLTKASAEHSWISKPSTPSYAMVDPQKIFHDSPTLASVPVTRQMDNNKHVEYDDISYCNSNVLGQVSENDRLGYHKLVERAFIGDNVVEEFKIEKSQHDIHDAIEAKLGTKLPGWGSWAGTSKAKFQGHSRITKSSKKAREVSFNSLSKHNVVDVSGAEKVIKSGKFVKKHVKYQASILPFPFESRQQYDRSLRLPIGPEWTTKETYQQATTPRVLIKSGRVIEALAAPLI